MQFQHLAYASLTVLSLCQTASATVTHPSDPYAVLVDSLTVHVLLPWTGGGQVDLTTADDDADIEHIVTVWATSNGIELVGDVSSTVIRTTGVEIPDARTVFTALSDAAIDSMIARALLPASQGLVLLYQSTAVEITAIASGFVYTSCVSGAFSARTYGVTTIAPRLATLLTEDQCGIQPPIGCSCTAAP